MQPAQHGNGCSRRLFGAGGHTHAVPTPARKNLRSAAFSVKQRPECCNIIGFQLHLVPAGCLWKTLHHRGQKKPRHCRVFTVREAPRSAGAAARTGGGWPDRRLPGGSADDTGSRSAARWCRAPLPAGAPPRNGAKHGPAATMAELANRSSAAEPPTPGVGRSVGRTGRRGADSRADYLRIYRQPRNYRTNGRHERATSNAAAQRPDADNVSGTGAVKRGAGPLPPQRR